MAITTGQISWDNTVPTTLCTIPPGQCSVVLANLGPATVAVGSSAGTSPLTGNGFLLNPGAVPTSFVTSAASKGAGLNFCVVSNGQTATVSYILST